MAQTRIRARLLTPEDVAEILNVGKRTVYSYIEKGWLPAAKLGPSRLLRVKESDLEAFLGMSLSNGDAA